MKREDPAVEVSGGEETASEGGRTAESEVDSPPQPQIKEDNDWFMDLNLDDLHSSFMPTNGGATKEMAYLDYYLTGLPLY